MSRDTPDVALPPAPTKENSEWQLSELIDAIAAEIDRAEDTLSLKSYARGLAFALKQLSLELTVNVRRRADGRILFQTVNPPEAGATVIRLDLAQMLQSQLEGVRKPLEHTSSRDLTTLPEITGDQILALRTIAIYSVDDLERYTQTAAMIAEVSRKTGISDARIRFWRGLPFINEAKPPSAPPGSTILLEGGNFGATPDANALVLFQGQPAKILEWSQSRLRVTIAPAAKGAGALFAVICNQVTNSINWDASSIDLFVRDIVIVPAQPIEGDEMSFEAELINQGGSEAEPFSVQWTIDNDPKPKKLAHGPLRPGQLSQDSSVHYQTSLKGGPHTISFTADPDKQIQDINPANSTFSKAVSVRVARVLRCADIRPLQTLDPLLNLEPGPADVLRLVFRGLLRLSPQSQEPIPDLAESFETESEGYQFNLRGDVRFHNDHVLTAADVAFTYRRLKEIDSPWCDSVSRSLAEVVALDERKVLFKMVEGKPFPLDLFRIGIVPRKAYKPNPKEFGFKPVGSGPFRVEDFTPGKPIVLRAFHDNWEGIPRFDRITIAYGLTDEELTKQILSSFVLFRNYEVVALTFSRPVYDALNKNGWVTTPAPKRESSPVTLLQAQSPLVQERTLNQFDRAWNSHAWYILNKAVWDSISIA